ncbi:MAG: T9SS type A sorting domain-containing protein [Bacteroidia bacterium]|nr:T9SS type A sorting domain-containing protein [Bacteroidia bacterium]
MKKTIILTLITLFTVIQIKAQNIVNEFWETDGQVNASVKINNKLYIGGDFSYVGPTTGSLVAYRNSTGAGISLPFNLSGKVNDIVKDNSGNIYIAGLFSINGNPAQSIVKITPNFLLDASFQFNFNNEISDLAINGTNLYVLGLFSTVNSQLRLSFASINLTTNQLSSFAPNPDGQALSLAVANGNLYVGGLFSIISGAGRNSFAVYNASNVLQSLNIPIRGSVKTIIVKDSLLFLGGTFDSIGGIYRKNVGSLNVNTSQVRNWKAHTLGTVNDMDINNNSLYLGGNFSQVGTSIRNNMASVHILTGIVETFDPGLDAAISNVKVNNGTIYVGGDFNFVGSDNRKYYAAISTSGISNLGTPLVNAKVEATYFVGDTVIVGGTFSSFGGRSVYNLAAFDYNTGSAVAWPISIDGTVTVLKQIGSKLLVGGDFYSVNQLFRRSLAIVDTVNGTPTSFDVECDGSINDVILAGTNLIIGGNFSNFGTSARNNLAMVNLGGTGVLQSWNPNLNGQVRRLLLNQTQLYAIGDFTQVGSTVKKRMASFELSNNFNLRNWSVVADSTIHVAIAVGSKIIVGGNFLNINGVSRSSIASLDTATAATGTLQIPLVGNVLALKEDNGLLYVGGDITTNTNKGFTCFTIFNAQEINFPVKVKIGSVNKIWPVDNRLVLSGSFTLSNSSGKSNFALVNLSVSSPTVQASAVSFSQVGAVSFRIHFNKGNGDKQLVLIKQGNAVDTIPVNGLSYIANSLFGSGDNIGGKYVVYNGVDTTVLITGLNTGSNYHVAVFTYNGFSSNTNYLNTNPARGNITTVVGYNPPTAAASNIIFSDVRVSQMVVKWTKGNGTKRYLVGHEAVAVSRIPSDSTQYLGRSDFGSGTDLGTSNFIVYDGVGDSVLVTNLKGGTTYYFSVFEYNGNGQFSRVLKTGSPVGNQQMLTVASEPTGGSSAVTFANTTVNSTQVNWLSGNGTSRVVVVREGSAVVSLPVDGDTYFTDNNFNGNSSYLSPNERIVYVGAGNQFTVSGLKASTTYHFALIEFNGSGYTSNYQSANFVRGNVTTKSTTILPLVATKNILFTKVSRDSIQCKWTKGDGQKRLVVIRKFQPVTSYPIQRAIYTGSSVYGMGDSLSDGSFILSYQNNDSITISNLQPNTKYYIAVFESNSSVPGPVYLSDSFAMAFITTQISVGFTKIMGENNLKIYPNPLSGEKLYIELKKPLTGNEIITITDIAGKIVYRNETGKNLIGEQHFQLDLGQFQKGQYLIQLMESDFIYSTTLLIN